MKSYDVALDIKRIRAFFDMSQQSFADSVNISKSNIVRYENKQIFPHYSNLENIYGYAYDRGLNLNLEKSRFYEEEAKDKIVLYHGSRGEIEGELDLKHSIKPNDFGDAFYVGESLKQSATWVSGNPKSSIYCFYFSNFKNLKKKQFYVDREWMYAILFYRGAFFNLDVPEEIKKVVKQVEESDYLIAPIADNKMYQIFNDFIGGKITDEACLHALSMTDLGMQYVIKSEKALKHLNFIDRFFLCRQERNDYLKQKEKEISMSDNKVKMSLIEYRRKGKYFDELFK